MQKYSLSPAQYDIWINQQLHKEIPLYNVGTYTTVLGPLDPDLFQRSVEIVYQNNDAFRIKFIVENGQPYQQVKDNKTYSVPYVDCSFGENPLNDVMALIEKEIRKPFDLLSDEPLGRIGLYKVTDNKFIWYMIFHHLVIDGMGGALLAERLAKIYKALYHGRQPTLDDHLSFMDTIPKSLDYLQSKSYKKSSDYWKKKFKNIPENVLASPVFNHVKKLKPDTDRIMFMMKKQQHLKLTEFANMMKVTIFHVLIGATYIYFSRLTQLNDFIIGLPLSNRVGADQKNTIGLFTDINPLRIEAHQHMTFLELVLAIKKTLTQDYRHHKFPIGHMSRYFRSDVDKRIYEIEFNYKNLPYATRFLDYDTTMRTISNHHQDNLISIMVDVFDETKDVAIHINYNREAFKYYTAVRVGEQLQFIFDQIIQNPKQRIGAMEIIPHEERTALRNMIFSSHEKFTDEQTLAELFEAQVDKSPNKIALTFDGVKISYTELNAKANRLACYIKERYRVKPDDIVGIMLERSIEMVVGVLAILKSGACYLPIALDFPKQRIVAILADSKPVCLIAADDALQTIRMKTVMEHTEVLRVEDWEHLLMNLPVHNLPRTCNPDHLAYILYSSGTTGVPKGAMLEHRGLINLIQHQIIEEDVPFASVLQFTPLTFDVSFQEIFSTLLSGGTLHLIGDQERKDIARLFNKIEAKEIETLYLPTSFFKYICNNTVYLDKLPVSVRYIITAGEQLLINKALSDKITQTGIVVYNHYGPTETHVVTSKKISRDAPIDPRPTIGAPVANNKIIIQNEHNALSPILVPGELCVVGPAVARGYLRRPDLTKEKFVEHPDYPNERVYKTGDLARWLPTGEIEFLGRKDDQVKIRGYRVELSEITAIMKNHHAVKDAVVLIHEDDQGAQKIHGFMVVHSEGQTFDKTQDHSEDTFKPPQIQKIDPVVEQSITAELKKRLPEYMVPDALVALDNFPLNHNGKLDQNQLKVLGSQLKPQSKGIRNPRNVVDSVLRHVWGDVLDIEEKEICIDDSYFQIGGDSLTANQIVSRVMNIFQLDISLSDLFTHHTLADFTDFIIKKEKRSGKLEKIAEIYLSLLQQSIMGE